MDVKKLLTQLGASFKAIELDIESWFSPILSIFILYAIFGFWKLIAALICIKDLKWVAALGKLIDFVAIDMNLVHEWLYTYKIVFSSFLLWL